MRGGRDKAILVCQKNVVPLQSNSEKMYNRSLDIIFATSGMPVPTEEVVNFEAQEIVDRHRDPRSLLAAFRAIENPYLREALAWRALNYWHSLEKQLDERACYSDGDGNICFCWRDVDDAVKPIIKSALSEQVALEAVDNHEEPSVPTPQPIHKRAEAKSEIHYHFYGNVGQVIGSVDQFISNNE